MWKLRIREVMLVAPNIRWEAAELKFETKFAGTKKQTNKRETTLFFPLYQAAVSIAGEHYQAKE